jgi:hypothetical protein
VVDRLVEQSQLPVGVREARERVGAHERVVSGGIVCRSERVRRFGVLTEVVQDAAEPEQRAGLLG